MSLLPCSLFLLCPGGTLRRVSQSSSFFILSVQCSTFMCFAFMHVWRLSKCVSSDNTPYCPPHGCWDIAVLCLRCRKGRNKKKRCIHKKILKWFAIFPAGKRCRLAGAPRWKLQDTISVKEAFLVYSYNFLGRHINPTEHKQNTNLQDCICGSMMVWCCPNISFHYTKY